MFRLSTNQICLIHRRTKDGWSLPKGRRNCGEQRLETAVREIKEETGYKCRLQPVSLSTRAPPDEPGPMPDVPRPYTGVTEPFMCTIRQIGERNIKIIFWYIAVVDEDVGDSPLGEADYRAEFFSYEEALEKLALQEYRDVVQRAVFIVSPTPALCVE
jgi:8-oxo-dGTP pyrophosphatase MutT (NUDIX family)